jgi:hypothetical protein
MEEVGAMIGALRHRGPDEFGVYRDRDAALGHARLSIIDLATGQQPLTNETGTVWLSFNGEIFNYIELRAELEGARSCLPDTQRHRSDRARVRGMARGRLPPIQWPMGARALGFRGTDAGSRARSVRRASLST